MRAPEAIRPALSIKERLMAEIERRRRRKRESSASIPPLGRAQYPLTHAQQRLWFLDKMEGPSAAYNIAIALRFEGALDLDALRGALRALIDRHPALRTRFETRDGAGVQLIQPGFEPVVRVVDLRATPEGSRLVALSLEKNREVSKPFGVEDPALIRAAVVLLDTRRAVLLLTMHHIVSDGWSMNVAVRDLLASYVAQSQGVAPELPALPVQYGDFAQWQHEQSGQLEAGLEFWRAELAAAAPLLNLPLDRPRPARASHSGDVHLHRVSASTLRGLEAYAQRHRVSVFAILMSSFSALLARHSGQSDLVVGMPSANRDRPELTDLIGFFANTVPLRVRVDGAADIDDLVQDVHARILRAMEHQAVPFERIVDALGVDRSLAHTPVFQVMFGLNNTAQTPTSIELPGLSVAVEPMPVGGAKFDLSVSYSQSAAGLEGQWEYGTDLFDHGTVEALARRFHLVLSGLIGAPVRTTSRIPLLDSEEERLLLHWGTGPRQAECASHPVAVFQSLAQTMPDAVAVMADDRAVCFGALERLSNQLAHRLQALGVRSEDRVALLLERNELLPAVVLAVLKCGAAYVPLDPRMPLPRVSKILEDCRARLIVCPDSLAAALPAAIAIRSLCESAADMPGHAPTPTLSEDSIVYVVYTSGTSGVPKGVSIHARGLLSLVTWHARAFEVGGDARATLLAGVGFDAMAWELWANLLRGACLCMPPDDFLLDAAELARYLDAQSISHCFTPTPLGESLLPQLQRVRSLRVLLLGGDRLSSAPLARVHFRIINNYGPTETTVVATSGEVGFGTIGAPDIGRPIDNLSAYVVDPELQLQPAGVMGELYIGGVGLAQGYLHQPALTAERFIPDPFSRRDGARLYRTGDVVRWRADGTLEFLGRADSQMKIRGHRIEAGEIESQLLQHSAISQAAVLLRSDPSGSASLVAYISGKGGDFDTALLQAFLRERLPDYMVPALFVRVEQFPITSNGKLDRSMLPMPDWSARAKLGYAEPVGETESALAALWSEMLGQAQIGRNDTFFELGGHSMLAARMIESVRTNFGVAPPLKELWSYPGLSQFAARLDALIGRDAAPATVAELPRIDHDPARRHEPFALTDVQHAYWMGRSEVFEIGNVAAHAYSEHDLRTPEFSLEAFEAIVNRLIARHDMLRMIVLEDGTQQILTDPGRFRIAFRDLADLPRGQREAALLETRAQMSHHVFAPDQWPLFDLRITRIEADAYRLYWSFDGLVLDGFSQQILIREMFTLLFDERAELPPLGITFRDYVVGLEALRRSALFERAQTYWLARLEDFPAAPELPLAVEPSQISQPRFVRREFYLPAPSWERIRHKARKVGVTPSSVLLSAYGEVLARWSKNQRLALNLTMFNRLPLHVDVDRLLGDFTSLTLLEIDCRQPRTFAERCHQVQQQLWEDMEHRHFTGLDVMRELRRRIGTGTAVRMPVVFSSMLDMEKGLMAAGRDAAPSAGNNQRVFAVSQTSQVWLDHQASDADGALHLAWDAVEELFGEGVLDGMFAEYVGMLQRLAAEPAQWESGSRAGLPARQRQVRERMNATRWQGSDELLQEGFFRRAIGAPEALAVSNGSVRLSYGQLRQLSSHTAHRLREAGIGRNELVGVVMRKGWEQVVAVLAILEAGAAYLPIDAGLPAARIEQLLGLGAVRAVLTQQSVDRGAGWPPLIGCWVIDDQALQQPARAPLPAVQATTDLAYVIFTSGSTGEPKGVMIDHRGARNTIDNINEMFQVGAADRVLALSSLSFDLSVYDIFGVLAAGGAIVLPQAQQEKDPAHWSQLLSEGAVSVWNSVPALMQLLVEYHEQLGQSLPGALREVMLSGDWIPVGLPDRIRALNPAVHVTSLGGATEASIWSIYYPIGDVDPDWKSIPYGRPLANQSYHVLKDDLSECPDWVVGHLYIGGVGVAQGYWRDERKSAQSFITHPRNGQRLYRTGDLGRYLPNGDIEFLGREDGQVKVQGHRIELGEIEAALLRQPAVEQSVVIALGERAEHKRLVGYVVLQAAAAAPKSEGSARIRDELERVVFKLSRAGLRSLPGSESVPLPGLSSQLEQSWASLPYEEGRTPTLQSVGQWLCAIAGWPVEGAPLPKYHYPSSGSLNPIQTYLECGAQALAGVAAGMYYYDPVGHRLQRVGDGDASAAQLTVHLVAALAAIEPMYGDAGRMLCELEAGYVAESLRLSAAVAGIALQTLPRAQESARSRLGLSGKAQVLLSVRVGGAQACAADQSLKLYQRQSYRQYADRALTDGQLRGLLGRIEPHAHLQWYAHVREGAVEGWAGGYYCRPTDVEGGSWQRLELPQEWPPDRYAGDSAHTHAAAAVAIYAVGEAGGAAHLHAGAQGQRLSVAGVKSGMGVCPIGGFNSAGLQRQLDLPETHGIVHSWLIGAIDPAHSSRWQSQSTPSATSSVPERLRAALGQTLPAYMVPSVIVILDRLPLTGNGKVDRRALPAPDDVALRPTVFEPPRTALEIQLATIWQEVLGLERVGIHDHFFESGGDSLKAVQVQTRLRAGMRIDLELRELYGHPSIEALANIVAGRVPASPDSPGSSIKSAAARYRKRQLVAQMSDEDVAALLKQHRARADGENA